MYTALERLFWDLHDQNNPPPPAVLNIFCLSFQIHRHVNIKDRELVAWMAKFGPVTPKDHPLTSVRTKISRWNRCFPRDPRFYAELLKKLNLWESFAHKSLRDFLQSPEARDLFETRRRRKIRPLYELDSGFRPTRPEALKNLKRYRSLVAAYPLLTYSDLQRLGVRNLQFLYEHDPARLQRRARALERIRKALRVSSSANPS